MKRKNGCCLRCGKRKERLKMKSLLFFVFLLFALISSLTFGGAGFLAVGGLYLIGLGLIKSGSALIRIVLKWIEKVS